MYAAHVKSSSHLTDPSNKCWLTQPLMIARYHRPFPFDNVKVAPLFTNHKAIKSVSQLKMPLPR